MDPATLALLVSGLGAGLGLAFTKLFEKGLIDPALETGLEPLREWLKRGYNQKKDEAGLRKAVEAALQQAGGEAVVATRLGRVFNALKDKPARAQLVAAAAIEMVRDDPTRLPPDLLKELDLPEDQRAPFARFVFELRKGLSTLEPYAAGIRYADQLETRHLLEGLYERVSAVADTVTDTPGGKALRVQIAPPDTRALERPYLEYLQAEFGAPGMDSRAKDKAVGEPVRLERVYIALNTTETRRAGLRPEAKQEREETQPLSALRAVMELRRAVVLGHPGSGKSTFAQHLCLCLARARAGATEDEAAQWQAELKSQDVDAWALPAYFPLFIRLRALAADFDSLPEDDELGQDKHVLAFLEKQFQTQGFSALYPHVLDLLTEGHALVIFDGLDEVRHAGQRTPEADAARRLKVTEAVRHFSLTRFPNARSLLTCRIRQYRDATGAPTAWAKELERWPAYTLADFDWPQARQFVEGWFTELHARGRGERDPQAAIASLLHVFEGNPRLHELTTKPIVLTQMALVHAVHQLPDSRVEVYVECAKLLLWEWELLKAKLSQRRETAEEFLNTLAPGLAADPIRKALDEAVFQAHEAGEVEVSGARLRAALQRALAAHTGSASPLHAVAAQAFIDGWLRDRNGLLVPATGDDSFDSPHLSLREFMAGRFLHENRLAHPKSNVRERWDVSGPRLVKTDLDKWREVFRFAAGLEESREEVADALNRLCPSAPSLAEADIRHLFLAATVTVDVGRDKLCYEDNEVGQRVFERMQSQLIQLLRDTDHAQPYPADAPRFTSPTQLSPKTRLAAGEWLNDLGWTPSDLDDFIPIRNTQYAIRKYPVTNLQYQRFLRADDYADESLWRSVLGYDLEGRLLKETGQDAWKWFRENGGKDRRPGYWDDARFGASRSLFPVVGVTWYEAAAYCAWLGQHREYVKGDGLPENAVFRLPLETEWKDAVGGEANDRYPWQQSPSGKPLTAETITLYANTNESDLGGTTPVCMYPAGMSLAGVMDMSGNVWEWQANMRDETWQALRGGSWYYDLDYARVASRLDNHRYYDWSRHGFRVVGVVPVSR